ncbi:hypothetical protein GCM10010174_31610 [Kutzneria viridogrisea]|uniref:Uncharacterized protein n=2 Tax=Kutzneria TaxID=43356 RepID=W5W5L2_9PSEU|nr:DUF5691 domain-containing protein [Kutzneria albida]AHH93494.1 hypothetical protein KALB_117 [Kutzneria albida DSM 43870]MBA8929120.1 hypothetical protein [Kutzneria viridogrisea]
MSAIETQWQQAVQQLLVGARRSGVSRDELLAEVAALGLARFGARLPVPGEPITEIPSAPAEVKPSTGPAARSVLAQILSWDDDALLTEWCATANRHGVVAAPAHLPQLLALGAARATLRPAINLVLGVRGRWLAEVAADWGWARGRTEHEPVDLDAPPGRRLTALRAARRQDPAAVRELVAEQLPEQRRASDRQLLVNALEVGLGAADEPLLEAALDDRAAGVHDVAVRLLRRLPGSALSQRAADRLREGLPCAEVLPGGRYDTEPDEAELRDLIRDGSTESGLAGRLRGAAASVSPEFWDVEQVLTGHWAKALLQGIAEALPLAADPVPWAVAASQVLTGMAMLDAIDALPGRTAAEVLVAVSGGWKYDMLDHGCSQLPGPWPPDITAVLLDRFGNAVTPGWRTGRPPPVLLTRGDVGVLDEHWPRIAQRWPEHTNEQAVLRLRVELRDAFENDRKELP